MCQHVEDDMTFLFVRLLFESDIVRISFYISIEYKHLSYAQFEGNGSTPETVSNGRRMDLSVDK